ncbi:MAG TPA: hypothetical protein VGC88_11750 [Terriglobales bacterium]
MPRYVSVLMHRHKLNSMLVYFVVGGMSAFLAWDSPTRAMPVEAIQRSCFAVLAFFALGTFCFLRAKQREGTLHLSNLSVWLGVLFFAEFGVAPCVAALLGYEEWDYALFVAMSLATAGSAAYWIGTSVLSRLPRVTGYIARFKRPAHTRLRWIIGLFLLSTVCKLALITAGLYMYAGTGDLKHFESISFVQWLVVPANFGWFALAMMCTERFGTEPCNSVKRWTWVILSVNLLFGLVSGMKSEILMIPLIVFIMSRLVTGRTWWTAGFGIGVLLVLMYPVHSYFRQNLRDAGGVGSVGKGVDLAARSLNEATTENSSYELLQGGFEASVNRLNLLSTLHWLLNDGGTTDLKGGEKAWMVPIYAFVPRVIWPDKPVLDKGRRLSLAMGAGDATSTAVTPFGDLYILGGAWAIPAGMFFLGVLIQAFANLVQGTYDAKKLFIYMLLFQKCMLPEADLFLFWSGIVQTAVVACVVGFAVYGGAPWALSAVSRGEAEDIERAAISLETHASAASA